MTHPVAYRQILASLVARYGWRFSNLDARRAGIRESVLFDAARAGLARIEHTSVEVTTYLVYA